MISSNIENNQVTLNIEVTSENENQEFEWSFNDTTIISNIGEFNYNFETPGTYTVEANVTSGDQTCHEVFTFEIEDDSTINSQDSCDLAFDVIAIDSNRVELVVTGGNPQYEFIWGDETHSTSSNPWFEHHYLENGEYTITVNDVNCSIDTTIVIDNIVEVECDLEFTAFVIDDERVEFVVGGGSAPYTYNLGDGATQTSENPWYEHFYEENGEYTITVHSNGCSLDTTILIDGVPNIECDVQLETVSTN